MGHKVAAGTQVRKAAYKVKVEGNSTLVESFTGGIHRHKHKSGWTKWTTWSHDANQQRTRR